MKKRLRHLLKHVRPDLVAIDMPIGKTPVTGYREADRETTRAFSRYGCPVHSPTPQRPGEWGELCMKELCSHGYQVASAQDLPDPAVAEVYPHTALLEMKRLSYRYPYKVTRVRRLWPDLNLEDARRKGVEALQEIHQRLSEEFVLPSWEEIRPPVRPLSGLKTCEDLLDALICAWAGRQILVGNFRAYGDHEAAIWNPNLNNLDPPVRPT